MPHLRSTERPATRRSAPTLAAALLSCSLATAALSGCASGAPPGAISPTEHPAASAVITSQLRVGDCVNGSADTLMRDLALVGCAGEHDWEVYSINHIPGEEYPGDDASAARAAADCASAFESFVGIAYDRSALDYVPVNPDNGAWVHGNRSVVCLVGDPSGRVTGSLSRATR
jgi:hypothetical protein